MKQDFATKSENGVITHVGKSTVTMPTVKWNGKGIKWFDDSSLLKKDSYNKDTNTEK